MPNEVQDKKKEIQSKTFKAHSSLQFIEAELKRRKKVAEIIDNIEHSMPVSRQHQNPNSKS